ncbi:MAG: hypothetical protein GX777_06415 [Fastidiosipila sp.]|nr:hypothetical protein [Fastidiosipila sp.]
MGVESAEKKNSVYLEKRLANAFIYIRRRSFGYNTKNTCSAVSLALALNYLALQKQNGYVPLAWQAELLDEGLPGNAQSQRNKYPQAGKLSRYLIGKCGLSGASFAFMITRALKKYSQQFLPADNQLELRWTFAPRTATVKKNIDANIPVLITTTLAKEFSWHTMLVYGYREIYGKTELLVHSGWYQNSCNNYYSFQNKVKYFQKEIWLDKRLACFGYYFSLI